MTAPTPLAIKLLPGRARQIGDSAPDAAEPVISPCMAVCRMDPATGLCQGCFRTLDEIAAWSRMDNAARRAVWALIAQRLPQPRNAAAAGEATP